MFNGCFKGEVIMGKWHKVFGRGLTNEELTDMIRIRYAMFVAVKYYDDGTFENVKIMINPDKISLMESTYLDGNEATLIVIDGHDYIIPIKMDLVEKVLQDVNSVNNYEFSKN